LEIKQRKSQIAGKDFHLDKVVQVRETNPLPLVHPTSGQVYLLE
jgi:hypothetical protein